MKKALVLLLAMIMAVGLCACGMSRLGQSSKGDLLDEVPVAEVGQIFATDTCEATIKHVKITDDVLPPNPDGAYSHYVADEGKVYVDLCIAYKNTGTSAVCAGDVISGKLIYAGQYEYKGSATVEEDNRSDFTYANITDIDPLSTEYIHYLFEVPEDVESSGREIILHMTIDGAECKIIAREGNGISSDNHYQQEEEKTSGEVMLGEEITLNNAEFSIDYANITNDVMPPNPDSYYSHYVADDGKVYVDICFAYKNTDSKSVDADRVISAKLKYAGKYDYKGFSTIEEDNRGDFTYTSITSIAPLSTEYVHYLFEVPEEVGNSNEAIVITFTIDGNTYTYTVR